MPIPLGILAAAGVQPGGGAGVYELIQTVSVGSGGQASITFANLNNYASVYQHLQVRYTSRVSENIGGEGTFYTRLNGDTGANYARHMLRANGSSATSIGDPNMSSPDVGFTPGSESAANIWSSGIIDLLDPFESKNKTMRTLSGYTSGYKIASLSSVLWRNTNSVTSWSFHAYGSFVFVQGSRFSIYGIRSVNP